MVRRVASALLAVLDPDMPLLEVVSEDPVPEELLMPEEPPVPEPMPDDPVPDEPVPDLIPDVLGVPLPVVDPLMPLEEPVFAGLGG